ncbi:MAG: tRNA pseudouridine(38-40) synthase TruA [Chloroflexi bacterium]|nr:tRNA pseudouridine(38-40) synthase TruA [Chloroflexota bacterium]
MVLEYDGTNYAGFQLQANAPTIQGEMEKAVACLSRERVRVQGAGRTDAGVHAQGQMAAFATASNLPCEVVRRGLNHYLPPDIAVQAAYDVPLSFDVRRHAVSRVYRYTILNKATSSPLLARFAARVKEPLDAKAMGLALALLHGEHDFALLASSPGPGKSTVREVFNTRLWQEDKLIHVEVEANAFLPHQMRRTAGLLVSFGAGRISLEEVAALLDGHADCSVARWAPTMPSRGLCLTQVKYKDVPPYEHQTHTDL